MQYDFLTKNEQELLNTFGFGKEINVFFMTSSGQYNVWRVILYNYGFELTY